MKSTNTVPHGTAKLSIKLSTLAVLLFTILECTSMANALRLTETETVSEAEGETLTHWNEIVQESMTYGLSFGENQNKFDTLEQAAQVFSSTAIPKLSKLTIYHRDWT